MKYRCALFLAICLSLGSANAQPYLFVFLTTNPNKPVLPKEQVDSIMAGHMANIGRLAKEGKLLIAGPFYDGGGIFVLATASNDTAWEWLKTDPAVRANRWNIEFLPYQPRRGGVCAVGDTYTMTTYQFVRYTVTEGVSGEQVRKAWDTHERHLRTFLPADSVVAEGMLGGNESAIFIFRGEPKEEFIKSDPAVRDTLLKATMRKIFIARGSLCEE